MPKLPEEVKKAISKQDVFPVATSSRDGTPNVVYIKFLKTVDDETVLIADNYFNKTRNNIINNGKVAFVVLDEEKGSYQVKGTAERLEEGTMYDEVQKWCSDDLPKTAAVVMHTDAVYNGAEKIC